jgi:predicted Rossmann fold nucleotide-binding protein DprA/Smf involved in DNA uptake
MTAAFTHDDRIATIAACSMMDALAGRRGKSEPLAPSEWSKVAQWLHERGLRPADLLDTAQAMFQTAEGLDPRLAQRLVDLPERAALVALELEQYESRGIWSLVRFDDAYPQRWRERLKSLAPPVIFGAGPKSLLQETPALAIVGSRDIGEELAETALAIGVRAAGNGYMVVSGGARGSDRWGMYGALQHGRDAVGVLHGDLAKDANKKDTRQYIEDGHLCLVAHVHPATGFVIGNAMARNRYIHALADAAVVISTAKGSGGTWAGSIDNLKKGWSPLLVWNGPGAPEANDALIKEGGYPFDTIPEGAEAFETLIAAAQDHAANRADPPEQPSQPQLL